MLFVQEELQKIAKHWNLHRIGTPENLESPTGCPDLLFYVAERTNTKADCMTEVDPDDVHVAIDLSCDRLIPAPY